MARYYCFTLNTNMDDPWVPDAIDWLQAKPAVQYVTCGLERASTGQIHWQGYIEFNNKISIKGAKKAMESNTVHLEARKGSRNQAVAYCHKMDETAVCHQQWFEEWTGDAPITWESETGNKTKIIFTWGEPELTGREMCYEMALKAESYDEAIGYIMADAPRDYVLYNSAITRCLQEEFKRRAATPREPKSYNHEWFHDHLESKAVIFYGASNTGKTEFALDHFKFPLIGPLDTPLWLVKAKEEESTSLSPPPPPTTTLWDVVL